MDLKPTFDLRKAVKEGTATEIEYGDLWHLFELGDTVVNSSDRAQAFRVVNFTGGRELLTRHISDDNKSRMPRRGGVGGFAVDCCSLCFDGTDYVPVLKKFLIRKYQGYRPFNSLEVFSLKFDQDWEARCRELETQGQKFLNLTRVPFSHHVFRGRTIDEPPQQLDTQVIVDVTLAINNEPDWQLGSRVSVEDFTEIDERETKIPTTCYHNPEAEGHFGSDYVFKDLTMNHSGISPSDSPLSGLRPRKAEDLKQEDIILLPKWVHAFVLRSRQWVTLNTEDLSEVQFQNNFDELVFSPSHKQTIVALVETHESTRTSPTQGHHSVVPALDLVRGKGAGLIILLHGEPGETRITHDTSVLFSRCCLRILMYSQESGRHRRLSAWRTRLEGHCSPLLVGISESLPWRLRRIFTIISTWPTNGAASCCLVKRTSSSLNGTRVT